MEDLEGLSLRELLTLARERLGAQASVLKTRDELREALRAVHAQPPSTPLGVNGPGGDVVTRDFFLRREG